MKGPKKDNKPRKKGKIKKNVLIFFIFLLLVLLIISFNHFKKNLGNKNYLYEDYLNYKCPECNVILISLDTLRADHLGCYGYERNTSPNINKFAEDSIVFKNAYSQAPWTLPSFISMFTSEYPPLQLNMNSYKQLEDSYKMPDLFKKNGFVTAAFTEGGYVSEEFGFNQGFDFFDDEGYLIESIYDRSEDWLKRNYQKKFFLWIHTYEINSDAKRYPLPYGEEDPKYKDVYSDFKGNFTGCFKEVCGSLWLTVYPLFPFNITDEEIDYIIDIYDEQVLFTDFYFKKLIDLIEELGIDEKTIIILHSDHGEEFMEHGLFRHSSSLYNSLIHIPLIIKLPGKNKGEIDYNVGLIDLFPTLVDILGLNAKKENMEGINLFSGIENRHIISINNKYFFVSPSIEKKHLQEVSMIRWVYDNFVLDIIKLNCTIKNRGCYTELIKSRNVLNPSVCKNSTNIYIEEGYRISNRSRNKFLQEKKYNKRFFYKLIECNNITYGIRIMNSLILHDSIIEEENIKKVFDSLSCEKLNDSYYNFKDIWFYLPPDYNITRTPPENDLSTYHYRSIQNGDYKLIVNENEENNELYKIKEDKNEKFPIENQKIVDELKNKLKELENKKSYENNEYNISYETYKRLKSLGYIG